MKGQEHPQRLQSRRTCLGWKKLVGCQCWMKLHWNGWEKKNGRYKRIATIDRIGRGKWGEIFLNNIVKWEITELKLSAHNQNNLHFLQCYARTCKLTQIVPEVTIEPGSLEQCGCSTTSCATTITQYPNITHRPHGGQFVHPLFWH